MNTATAKQCGSPSRDQFKLKHKALCKSLWACDLDFVLVDKNPPEVIAALDYNVDGDTVSFAEVLAYNALIKRGIPMYIVKGDVDSGRFEISRYIGGHHGKPTTRLSPVYSTRDWSDFESWERSLRKSVSDRFQP